MYFPQGFLTAVLQGYSRANKIAVDVLGFEFLVCDFDNPEEVQEDEIPDTGCLIYGMFIDGARWNYEKQVLDDQEPGVTYGHAPIIHFVPCQNYSPDPGMYSCPLYKTSIRAGTLSTTGHSTNFVLMIEVETDRAPSYWVLKGAAFLTMLND